ncbi:hypothetical protein CVT25_005323 [Psilocybe cyanescens]|uniref:Uncharacterized protein n=1 Tax=Psilocybe cyanescens TaxID=93625 RepID=A0A409VPR4_PSICY|nr:hypothetical protein CVT25_005323 [Psilocybe cyanescens]
MYAGRTDARGWPAVAREFWDHVVQLLISETLFGKIDALDAFSGAIIWSRVLGMGWDGGVVDLHLDEEGEGEGKGRRGLEVVLVRQRRADNVRFRCGLDSGLLHVVPTVSFGFGRGRPASASPIIHPSGIGIGKRKQGRETDEGGVLEGTDVVSGPLVEACLLNAEDRKIVVWLDEFLQFSFPLRTNVDARHCIVGQKITLPPKAQTHHCTVAHPVWALSFPEDEDVQAIVPQAPMRGRG